MKQFRDTEAWKWIRLLIELLLIAAAVWGIIELSASLGLSIAHAEDSYPGDEPAVAYVICMPGDFVNIRPYPSTRHSRSGFLEPGEEIYLDGRQKNGFLHIVNAHTESGEGWVHKGYVVNDKPERINQSAVVTCNGRLAARRYIGGKRREWLKPQATVRVYYWSDDWAMTDCGYVQSKYLELVGD